MWLGDSRERTRSFPIDARRDIGHQLGLVQLGFPAEDWKHFPTVGPGTIEIRVHNGGEYHVFYVAKFEDAIYILHTFHKKTRKTSRLDIELATKRYKDLLEWRRKCE
jgi:phage-related protein